MAAYNDTLIKELLQHFDMKALKRIELQRGIITCSQTTGASPKLTLIIISRKM